MMVIFFLLLTVLILLVIPIKFNISFKFNFLKNRGYVKFKVFNFKVVYYKLKYSNKKIVLSNFKTTKEIDFDINIKNIDFANELQKQVRKRLYLKKLQLQINVGVRENPFASALLSSSCEIALSIISSLLKFQKPTADINYEINNYYSKNMGIVNTEFDISMSITNLILSIVKTKIIMVKKEKTKQNGNKSKTSNRRSHSGYIKEY